MIPHAKCVTEMYDTIWNDDDFISVLRNCISGIPCRVYVTCFVFNSQQTIIFKRRKYYILLRKCLCGIYVYSFTRNGAHIVE